MLLFQVDIEGGLLALPIVFISFGGIAAITAIGMLIVRFVLRKNSTFVNEMAKLDKDIYIDEDDERNIAIKHRVMYMLSIFASWLEVALLIFLMVMQVELVVTLVFLIVFVSKIFIHPFLRYKYSREM